MSLFESGPKEPAPNRRLPDGWTTKNVPEAEDLNALDEAILELGFNPFHREYSAEGDGTADDSEALIAAVEAAQAAKNGGRHTPLLYLPLPPSGYRISETIPIEGSLHIRGGGARIFADVAGGYVFTPTVQAGTDCKVIIEDIYFRYYGTFGESTSGGIFAKDATPLIVRNCVFEGLGAEVLKTWWCSNVIFENCIVLEHLGSDIVHVVNGQRPEFTANDDVIYLSRFDNNFFQHSVGYRASHAAIRLDGGWNHEVVNNAFEVHGIGLRAITTQNLVARNNFFEGCVIGASLEQMLYPSSFEGNYFANSLASAWSAVATYAKDQLATSGGVTYKSLQGSNLNHAVGDASWWAAVSRTGIRYLDYARSAHAHRNHFTALDIGIAATHRCNRNDFADNEFSDSVGTPISGSPVVGLEATQLDVASVLVDPLHDATGWTKEFDSSTGSLSTLTATAGDGYLYGQSLALYFPESAGQSFFYRDVGDADYSDFDYFVMAVKFDGYANLRGAADNDPDVKFPVLSLGADGSNADLFGFDIKQLSYPDQPLFEGDGRWFLMGMPKSSFYTLAGSPDWSTIGRVRLNCYTALGAATIQFGGLWAVALSGVNRAAKLFDPRAAQVANADTSGATLGQLETEVNELKAILRKAGLLLP